MLEAAKIVLESVAKKMFQTSFLNEYDYFKWAKTPFYEVITGYTNNQDVLVHIYSQYEFFRRIKICTDFQS